MKILKFFINILKWTSIETVVKESNPSAFSFIGKQKHSRQREQLVQGPKKERNPAGRKLLTEEVSGGKDFLY